MSKSNSHNEKKILVCIIPVLILITVLLFVPSPAHTYQPSSIAQMHSFSKGIHPQVTILVGQSLPLNFSMTQLATQNKGLGHESETSGIHVPMTDTNLQITLSKGISGSETVISLTETNIGQQNLIIGQMKIWGGIPDPNSTNSTIQFLEATVVGCTKNYEFEDNQYELFPNGTRINHYKNTTVACPYPAAIQEPALLKPGQSFTAYIKGNFIEGNTPLTMFGAGGIYGFSHHLFSIALDHQSIG